MKEKIFKWAKILIIIYCLTGIALYYSQDKILFHPEKKAPNEPYKFDMPFNEVNIPFDSSSNINIIQFLAVDSTTKGVVLYFHGNGKNISAYAKFALNFTKNNYEVWMIDYPGFGKSTGKLSEQRLYDYALQLYKLARSKYAKDSIIIYGQSLGTGIAAQLASVKDCKSLVLEAPYYSIRNLAGKYFFMFPLKNMLHYQLPTNEYLKNVTAPVIIFHGTKDHVIPYNHSIKLKTCLKPNDEFVTVEGAEHNNLNNFLEFHHKLDSLLH